jgi:hypothetical protein
MFSLGRICNRPLNRTAAHSWKSSTRYEFSLELSRLFFSDGCHTMEFPPSWRGSVDFRRRREYAGAALRWAEHDPEGMRRGQTHCMSRPNVTVQYAVVKEVVNASA